MHQVWGLQITRYYSALGKPVPVQHIYRKQVLYATPVLCSAVLVTSSVADQATNTVPVYS